MMLKSVPCDTVDPIIGGVRIVTRALVVFASIVAGFSMSFAYAAKAQEGATIAIVGVDVVNPIGFESLDDATVLIKDGVIAAFGAKSKVATPADARVIDGADKWLIPGLMDLHVHLGGGGSVVGSYEMASESAMAEPQLGDMYDLNILLSAYTLESTLLRHARAGVTTIMSPGDWPWAYNEETGTRVRAAKMPVAPRVILATPGSHPQLLKPGEKPVFPTPESVLSGDFDSVVTIPEQGVAAIRTYAEVLNPDLQKIWFVDSKFIGEPEAPDTWLKLLPTVKAMVAEADQLGLRTAIDAIEVWRAKSVMPTGADLVHGVFFGEVDDEYISLMKQNKTRQLWTAIASERYFGAVAGHLTLATEEILISDPHTTAQIVDMRAGDTDGYIIPAGGSRFDGLTLTQAMKEPPYTEEIGVAVRNLGRVHKAGIPVAIGTDAGIPGIPYGAAIYAEFEKYLEAGFSDLEVLTAATINNAQYLEMEDQIGSVTVGKRADLVLLSADPSKDIKNAAKVVGLFRDGQYATADMLNDDTPFDVVTRLRNAFNLGDEKAFGALLSESVVLKGNGRKFEGRKSVVRNFGPSRKTSGLRTRLDHLENGSIVVQKERWPDGKNRNVRYFVRDNAIKEIEVLPWS
ncbi:MAG: amidohydrolase family protein [Pseudomonadota bacterium]